MKMNSRQVLRAGKRLKESGFPVQVRRAGKRLKAVKEPASPVQVDRASIDAMRDAMIGAVERMLETVADQKVTIDAADIDALRNAVIAAVEKMPATKLEPTSTKPFAYRIDNIATDRDGNILSADIRPIGATGQA